MKFILLAGLHIFSNEMTIKNVKGSIDFFLSHIYNKVTGQRLTTLYIPLVPVTCLVVKGLKKHPKTMNIHFLTWYTLYHDISDIL